MEKMILNDPHPSTQFQKGQLVVFKYICCDLGGSYSDHLHEVTRVVRKHNYLEIKETRCWHSNRRRWGSYGGDIRLATAEEIAAGSRLPKTITHTEANPECLIVVKQGPTDILRLMYYTKQNNLLVRADDGREFEVNINEVRELNIEEIKAGMRLNLEA